MPYLTKQQIEMIAARVLRAYWKLPAHGGAPIQRVLPELLAKELLGLTVLYRKIATAEHILGLTSPGSVDIEVIDESTGELQYQHIDGKTIIVDTSIMNNEALIGHFNFTLMHEICHQIYKMLFPKAYADEIEQGKIHYCKQRPRRGPVDWEEWRTDALAAAILMPPYLVVSYMHKYGLGDKMRMLNRIYARDEYERFSSIATDLGVSKTALTIRLRELNLLEHDYFSNPHDLVNIYVDDDWMRQEDEYIAKI